MPSETLPAAIGQVQDAVAKPSKFELVEVMLGHIVVVELDTDEVLVKRLLRGSRPGRYNLESFVGETRENVKIRWAAHVTAIIPPFQARRIIRSAAA